MAIIYRLCFACLNYKSKSHRCTRMKCGADGCQHYHHKLLHFVRGTEERDRYTAERRETVQSTWTSKGTFSYLKILPVTVKGPAGEVDTFALLDDGSTISLIDEDVANLAGLRGPIDPLSIEAFANNRISASTSRRVNLVLCGALQNYNITANTIEDMKFSPQTVSAHNLEPCKHLEDIKQNLYYQDASPKVLIGQDNWQLLLTNEVRKGRNDQPIASHTPLGWVLHGRQTKTLDQSVNFVNHLYSCEEIASPNNYVNTLKPLNSTEKKLDRDPEMKLNYNAHMKLPIENKCAEPAPTVKTEKKHSAVHKWPCIRTNINVTDDTTRDVPREFNENHRRFQGASFLRDSPSTWPSHHPIVTEVTGEEKVNLQNKTEDRKRLVPDHTKFSKWERSLRATARVLQFIKMWRRKRQKCTNVPEKKRERKSIENDSEYLPALQNRREVQRKGLKVGDIVHSSYSSSTGPCLDTHSHWVLSPQSTRDLMEWRAQRTSTREGTPYAGQHRSSSSSLRSRVDRRAPV